MNELVKVIFRTLRIFAHSLMVHTRVLVAYIYFALMYTTDHICLVLLIKDRINEDFNNTTPFKLATRMKPSVSHLLMLFCPCVVRKVTAHCEKKGLNMRHQAQNGFGGNFVGIPQHQKGYLVYTPSTRKIIFSKYVVSDESFSSVLSYTSQTYAEAMAMCQAV